MRIAITHSWFMAVRNLRNLGRQPWWVALTLVQPVVYIMIFADLFKRVVEIPGFGAGSYLVFLTPGVVVMTALFSSGWNGMGTVSDLDRGVLDRFLVSPASRFALIAGRIISMAVIVVVQSLTILGLGLLRGAHFSGGLLGVAALIGCAILLATPFAALSNGLALLMRKEESVIAAVNFILLPLTFLSSVFMAQSLIPPWMQNVARFNPVNWAVQAGREAVKGNTDWAFVLQRMGWLLVLGAVCSFFATRAFRTYQRSI